MKSLFLVLAIYSTILVGCKLANPENAISQMDSYWRIYENRQYDSLRIFYIPKGDNPKERLSNLLNELKKVDDRLGRVIEVRLTRSTTKVSLEGKFIDLDYEIIYKTVVVSHKFTFKEEEGIYKIYEHTVNV